MTTKKRRKNKPLMEAVTNEWGEFKMSDSMKRDIKDKDKVLTPLITKCRKCGYDAKTWHEDLENPEGCRKCGGKLEILARETKE